MSDLGGEQADAVRRTDLSTVQRSASTSAATGTHHVASGSSGWRSFISGTSAGKFPGGWRWLGVPALLALCTISGCWSWGHMESNLDERARAHLACEGIDVDNDGLDLDWSYRSVSVDGVLPAGVSAEQIEAIIDRGSNDTACLANAGIEASSDPGVYDVKVLAATGAAAVAPAESTAPATAVPATPEPTPEPTAVSEPTAVPEPARVAGIDAQAAFDGQTITLAGTVPTEEQRRSIVDAAVRAVGADNVVDQLRLADGEPSVDSSERATELARLISQFDSSILVQGTAVASDQELSYDLLAVSEAVRDALELDGSGQINVLPTPDDPSPDEAPAADEDDAPAAAVEFTG